MRLGHLASDLARIATLSGMPDEEETIKGVLEEAKFFAEWAAQEAELNVQMFLAEIQSFLALTELQWPSLSKDFQWRQEIAGRLRAWSSELLKKAGF